MNYLRILLLTASVPLINNKNPGEKYVGLIRPSLENKYSECGAKECQYYSTRNFYLITYNNLVLALNNFLYGIILGRPNYERVQAKFI